VDRSTKNVRQLEQVFRVIPRDGQGDEGKKIKNQLTPQRLYKTKKIKTLGFFEGGQLFANFRFRWGWGTYRPRKARHEYIYDTNKRVKPPRLV
jgi:hypothetical protein